MDQENIRNTTERLKNVAYAAKLLRLQEERSKQTGPGGLMHFIRYFWKVLEPGREFVDGWALHAVAEHLEAIERGELNRLLVTIPPGFMKSLMTNVFFMCWLWGPQNKPHYRSLSFSYAAHLTERDNEKCRTLISSRLYQELWGGHFKLASDSKIKISNDHQGWLLASSVGGISTGERGDIIRCCKKDTLIATDCGQIPIDKIVNNKLDVKIYGYNHRTKQVQLQNILAYEESSRSDFIELQWDGGFLHCTSDHPIFIHGRGYVPAGEVREGEFAYWTRMPFDMLELQEGNSAQATGQAKVLQSVVSLGSSQANGASSQQQTMCHLRKDGVHDASSLGSAQECPAALRSRMSWEVEQGAEQSSMEWWQSHQGMQVVRKAIHMQSGRSQEKNSRLLFGILREAIGLGREKTKRTSLRLLRKFIQPSYKKTTLLFAPLYGYLSWAQDFRKEQRSLCAWQSSESVSERMDQFIQKEHKDARWKLLSALSSWARSKQESRRSPHRLQQEQSTSSEFNNFVSLVPWSDARKTIISPVLQRAVIKSVARLPEKSCSVYNLRVEPCHNYFANGLLTHNCDDPHNAIQGESERVRNETVRWFKESMSNRLNDMEKSSIIVVHQRLNESDVAGSIIEDSQGMGYEHLCIPMRYEVDGPWRNYTAIGWEDPRTVDGELAWPERFPAKVVDDLERDLGPFGFSGQYQQNPSPRGGGIIKRNWFRLWEHPQNKFPPFENIVAAVDPAYTEKSENDPSAMVIFATFRHPETNEFGIMLVHCWRKRLQIHGNTSPRFPGESAKAYERRCGDDWGLVEWIWHCCDAYGVQQLFIEGKASGLSVYQEIERRQSLRPWSCDIDTGKGGGDKVSRLTSVQPIFSQGLIWAPDRDWADMAISELSQFPKGKYDDICDASALCLKRMREMGLIQHTDEREYDEYVEQNRPQALEPLYPV